MSDKILATFLQNNYSTYQIRSRFVLLKKYLSIQLYNAKQDQIPAAELQWLNSLGQDFYKNFTAVNATQLLSELDQQLSQIQPLVIYIPFDMPEEEIDKLGIWMREKISPSIVFEIKYDGNLIGGAALSWKGIYKDYSIRSRIEADKQRVIESMKKFLK